MAKIYYKTESIVCKTPCPFGHQSGFATTRVHSVQCTNHCKYYRSANTKEHYIICLADCSSRLEEILDKIDVVIANDKFDDICFEDFLAEIREGVAEVLDGNS